MITLLTNHKSLVFVIVFCVLEFGSYAQIVEVCDDAIDNDGDGLIDLNDDDCICKTAIPSGLIPNPSFEDYMQCPASESDLTGFAESWIQASEATVDFVHTCGGFLGNSYASVIIPDPLVTAPLPFPDGEGGIGFRDGKPSLPGFKEYIGSELLEPMEVGVTYKLDLFVGFHAGEASRRFQMAIFLSDEPNAIPFGQGDSNFGCPTNGPGWDLIGEQMVTGNKEWIRVQYEFTPTKPYSSIVIGPGCEIHPDFAIHPYFFMDRIVLAKLTDFSIPTSIYGDICDDQLFIETLPDQDGYQWYFEGVALVGQTGQVLELDASSPEGTYVAVIDTEEGCYFSDEYFLVFPPSENYDTITLCQGETFLLGNQALTDAGDYEELFIVGAVCDSMVYMTVEVNPLTEGDFSQTFCTGETVTHEGETYTAGGQYEIILTNKYGCDSILKVDLIEVDTAVEYYTSVELCEGESISFGSYQDVNTAGLYDELFAVNTGCDSMSVVEVIINRDSESIILDTICPGLSVEIASQTYDEPGDYQTVIPNDKGCDSIVNITITEVEGVGQLSIMDTVKIKLGETMDLVPVMSDNVVSVEWTNDDEFLSVDEQLIGLIPFYDTTYEIAAFTQHGCTANRSIVVEVDRSVKTYIPNVFSKQENNTDDKFIVGVDQAVKDIKQLQIYDRWGELVYVYEGSLEDYKGWNGQFNGGYVEQGVYTYVAEFRLVDDSCINRAGHVTFLH